MCDRGDVIEVDLDFPSGHINDFFSLKEKKQEVAIPGHLPMVIGGHANVFPDVLGSEVFKSKLWPLRDLNT